MLTESHLVDTWGSPQKQMGSNHLDRDYIIAPLMLKDEQKVQLQVHKENVRLIPCI